MPKKPLENLTESMFYLLMAFMRGPACGTDAAAWVREKTGRTVPDRARQRCTPSSPNSKQEKYIEEIAVEGRKRTYRITGKGRIAYREELERLKRCVADAGSEPEGRSGYDG